MTTVIPRMARHRLGDAINVQKLSDVYATELETKGHSRDLDLGQVLSLSGPRHTGRERSDMSASRPLTLSTL